MAEELTHTSGPDKVAVAATSAPPASPPGYELLDEIGHGGMGVVYRARDVALDRDVAVKLLSDRYTAGSPAALRFLSEARITGQLQHPGIPAVHQVGTLADGRPFLAMKLIKGSTLEVLLQERSDPSAERGRLLAIFEAVCQAVGYAHAHRVIHRDLKPANVMVGAFGEVQVMDWGLAKVLGDATPAAVDALAAEQTRAWTQVSPTPESGSHTQAGSLIGTPAFIPPEQAGGEIERVNERADVFGLGALLSVILTGKPPYVGETFESVRVQALRGKREDCFARLDGGGAEPELVALCKKCLAFEPADRPADAGAVASAVAGLRAAADERARRAELDRVRAEGRAAEQRRRRRILLAATGIIALVFLVGFAGVFWQWRAAETAREDTDKALKIVESEQESGRKLQYTTDMQLAPFLWKDDRTTAEQLRSLLARLMPFGVPKENGTVPAAPCGRRTAFSPLRKGEEPQLGRSQAAVNKQAGRHACLSSGCRGSPQALLVEILPVCLCADMLAACLAGLPRCHHADMLAHQGDSQPSCRPARFPARRQACFPTGQPGWNRGFAPTATSTDRPGRYGRGFRKVDTHPTPAASP